MASVHLFSGYGLRCSGCGLRRGTYAGQLVVIMNMSSPSSPTTSPAGNVVVAPELFRGNDVPAGVSDEAYYTRKIMLIDDEAVNVKVTRRYLEKEGYKTFITTTDASEAFDLIQRENPDLVLLDVVMPKVSGLDILVQLRNSSERKNIPVIILTASTSAETKASALRLGATDFLAKPVDPSELIPRVRNVLVVKAHNDHMKAYTEQLEKAVRLRTTELAASRKHVIECLARAAEYRDDSTGKHILRVGRYAGLIAQQLGFSEEQAELIEQAAQLHDVGKIAVPDQILKKDTDLDPAEIELMRMHCVYGLQIIQPMSERDSDVLRKHPELCDRVLIDSSPVVQIAGRIALSHHERWDGTGYPLGLAGEDIPIEGRITAVADVYDALSSSRPYKAPFPREKCFEFMQAEADKHFDRRILNAFIERSTDIVRIQMEFANVHPDS